MIEERQLLTATIAGDTTAFELIVRKYQNLVCAITFGGTGRIEASEELAQETFFNAWRNLKNLKDLERFRPWLCEIARNLVRNYHRKRKPEISFPDDHIDVVDSDNNPSENAVSREETMILEQALNRIPIEYREPLILFYRQGHSIRQVAEGLELNETTVKTRLHRGRQMLKEQTAAIVERTLERTVPDARFTKAVMVGIGAGLAAGVAGTASAAAIGTMGTGGSSVASTVTGMLSTLVGKVVVATTAVMVAAGVAVYTYQNSQEGHSQQPIALERETQENIQSQAGMPNTAVQEQEFIKTSHQEDETNLQVVPQETEAASIMQDLPPTRHPDWPGLNEPVNSIYIKYNDGFQMQRWIRFPRMHRSEDIKSIYIDNSKNRIEVSKTDATVQYSYALEKPLDRDGNISDLERYTEYIYSFGRSQNRKSDSNAESQYTHYYANYSVRPITQEGSGALLVYEIHKSGNEKSRFQTLAYVDAATRLPEKIQVFVSDPNHPQNKHLEYEQHYDFSPIPDSIFEYTVNIEQDLLPYKERPCIRGEVVDLMNNPVAGADVYVHYNFIRDKEYLMGLTDINGRFEIDLPPSMENWPTSRSVILPITCWALIPDQPDFVAWTMLTNDEQDLKILSEMPSFGGNVIQAEQGLETVTKVEFGVSTTYQRPSSILQNPVISDVLLVMEPAGTIAGYVTDKEGNTIAGSQLTAAFSVFLKDNKSFYFFGSQCNWSFSTISDSEGYYEIKGLPAFWEGAKYEIGCGADGYVSEQKEVELKKSLDFLEYDIALNPELVTVRGVLKDNYGIPLAGKSVSLSAAKAAINGCSGQTDPNGLFEIKGCPDIPGLYTKAWLSQGIPEGYPLTDKEKLESYIYYPDLSQKIPYMAGQSEYFIEIIAEKPEITIEVLVIDTAGKPLPDFKVKVDGFMDNDEGWSEKPIPSFWSQVKLEKRTDSQGRIIFDNVPDLVEMKLIVSPNLIFAREVHESNQIEKQRLQRIDDAYNIKYQEIDIPVELVEEQTDYFVEVVVLTKEGAESLPEVVR